MVVPGPKLLGVNVCVLYPVPSLEAHAVHPVWVELVPVGAVVEPAVYLYH